MKGKPIKIDWEELESAFDNKREDLVYYVDLVTGQVILEGEGEEALEDDDEEEEGSASGRAVSTRLYVDPLDPDIETDWMSVFVTEVDDLDGAVMERLRAALDDPDPHESIREILRNHAPERDRWFLFRSGRIHDAIDAWLEEHGVRATEPAPWK